MVPVHLQREGFIHAEHDIMTWTEDRPSDPGFGTSSERTGWIGKLDCGFFDGAKWSRRETPADPFEVTG